MWNGGSGGEGRRGGSRRDVAVAKDDVEEDGDAEDENPAEKGAGESRMVKHSDAAADVGFGVGEFELDRWRECGLGHNDIMRAARGRDNERFPPVNRGLYA